MITRIKKIKKLGLVFSDYTESGGLPEFKKTNLIFGLNGTGKTTLSCLFACIGHDTQEVEYKIEDKNGQSYTHNSEFNQSIRVFNQDYISENIKILEGKTNSISIVLGGENKKLKEEIEKDTILLNGSSDSPEEKGNIADKLEIEAAVKRADSLKGNLFTNIAKDIGSSIGGNALRTYTKREAESDFNKVDKKNLESKKLEESMTSAKQDLMKNLDDFVLRPIQYKGASLELLDHFVNLISKAETLATQTVESVIISRLAENDDIAQWVEAGKHLHEKYGDNKCEFCRQEITKDRIKQVALHFNEADKQLKEDIDELIAQFQTVYGRIDQLTAPDAANLYKNLRGGYEVVAKTFATSKSSLLTDIEKYANSVKEKKLKTTEAFRLKPKPEYADFKTQLTEVNAIIINHNKTSSDFEKSKKEAVKKLKSHFLHTISEDVAKHVTEVKDLKIKYDVLSTDIDKIQTRIAHAMTQLSSDHKACEVINEKLAQFLGHKEIYLEPHTVIEKDNKGNDQKKVLGYNIMRNNESATHLSESEKTALVFVYFVVHLEDQDFDKAKGIIVVDDPVSSLDTNSLYQAFSFLKNSIKDAEQSFVLTHNFDFLKLLLNWRKNSDRKNTGFFMINNSFDNSADIRRASIEKMDNELITYESEYHYLFKLLKQLENDQDGTIAQAYPVPNIARKVWDTFLMFSVPSGGVNYLKMETLKTKGHNEEKLDSIYKFTNDQSHITGAGFDPSLVPGAKKVIGEIFDIMEEVAPDHYKIICKAVGY